MLQVYATDWDETSQSKSIVVEYTVYKYVHILGKSIKQRKNVDDSSSSLKGLYPSKIQVSNEHVF